MTDLWPYSPDSEQVPKRGIIWEDAAAGAFDAPLKVWRKISQPDAKRLASDARFKYLFSQLPADVQEVVNSKAEGRSENRMDKKTVSGKSEKDQILGMLEDVLGKADDAGDLTAELRAIELRAKLHALLQNKTPEEDRNIVINVNTGIPRND